jgi:hypothetical protein
MTQVELWLPIGAAAFYLYDSALLLWQNELVYVRAGERWQVSGGSEIRLGSRRLYLPNPLTPHRPHFLVRWSAADPRAGHGAGADLQDPCTALKPIGMVNVVQLVLLAALPVALYSLGAGLAALGVFGLFYLATLLALVIVFVRRARFALSTRAFWALAFDVLACAPFAVNMTRKIALRHGLAGEPLRYAATHFDASALAHTREVVAARIREEHATPEALERQQQTLQTIMSRLES